MFNDKDFKLKVGLAEMLKGGVIMDVTTAEQARIAEDSGACAVMALERVPADIRKEGFKVPFVCGARNLGEALRRVGEGAAMIRTKGEAGSGNIVEAVRHIRAVRRELRRLGTLEGEGLIPAAKAVVKAVTHWREPQVVLEASRGLEGAMRGLDIAKLTPEEMLSRRGW